MKVKRLYEAGHSLFRQRYDGLFSFRKKVESILEKCKGILSEEEKRFIIDSIEVEDGFVRDGKTNFLSQQIYNILFNDLFWNKRDSDVEIMAALMEMVLREEKFYIVFVDFANFKKINDTRGYHIGDMILSWYGYYIIEKNIVGLRKGGDEFALFASEEELKKLLGEQFQTTKKIEELLNGNMNKMLFDEEIVTFPLYGIKRMNEKTIKSAEVLLSKRKLSVCNELKESLSSELKKAIEDYHKIKGIIKQTR